MDLGGPAAPPRPPPLVEDRREVDARRDVDLGACAGRRYSWTSSMRVPKLPFGWMKATVVPRLPDEFTPADLATTGFALTYDCELRTERAGHFAGLYEHGSAHYEAMAAAFACEQCGYRPAEAAARYRNEVSAAQRRRSGLLWALRRVCSMVLSLR